MTSTARLFLRECALASLFWLGLMAGLLVALLRLPSGVLDWEAECRAQWLPREER